jgi:hypothetical protein
VLVGFDFVNREQHELDGRVYRDVEEEGESSVKQASKYCPARFRRRQKVVHGAARRRHSFWYHKKTELRDWVPATPRRIDGLITARTEHGCAPR